MIRSTVQSHVLTVMLVLFGCATTVVGQQDRFADVTDVVAIEVPVQVIKDGQPVTGLTAEDFEIVDGGRRRQITGFEEINLETISADVDATEVPPLPIGARRHFLFLFDLSFSRPDSVTQARTAAKRVVDDRVHPSDLMAVGTYSAATGFRLVLGFSPDREQVKYAIDTMGLAQPMAMASDPLGLLIADIDGVAIGGGTTGAGFEGTGTTGSKDQFDPGGEFVESLRELRGLSGQAAIDQRKSQMLAFTSSMESVAALLRSVDGRAQVVLLSEGFDTSILVGNQGFTQAERDRMNERADNIAFGQTWKEQGDETFGSGAALSGMNQMLEEFRRADAVINAVDVGGLRAGGDVERGSSRGRERQNSLYMMADGTGGELYKDTNDLGEAMSELFRRTSVTYLLAFQPEDLKWDGEYHRLKVKLTGGPKKARVIHRPGYYAPKPFAERTPIERRLAAAGLVMGGRTGGAIPLSVLAVPVGTVQGEPYVPVLIEVEGESFAAGTSGDVLPAEIYAYAVDERGSIRDFFTQVIGVDLSKYGEQLRQTGFKFWGELDLTPGDYVVRVLMRNGSTGASTVEIVELRVPDPSESDPMLLPPLFPEPMGKWIMAREQNRTERASGFPFVMGGETFFPASRPQLAAAEPATVCLIGLDLAGRPVELSARLLDDEHGEVEGASVELKPMSGGRLADGTCSPARISVTAPGSGDYLLEVVATDRSGDDHWASTIPIAIEG